MNRRGFLKAAASMMPAAALAAPAAGAIAALEAAPLAAGGAAIGAVGAAGFAAPWTIAGTVAAACYAAMGRLNDCEAARAAWLIEYRRHRIAARRGLVKREPAKLIWARKKLLDLQRRKSRRDGDLPEHPDDGPRARKALLHYKRRDGRVNAALKRMGFTEWPWGGGL